MSNVTPEQIQFTVFAIEAAAQKMGIPAQELYRRLKRLDLIRKRLFAYYDLLHTQSREYIADDLIETLHNWETNTNKENKENIC